MAFNGSYTAALSPAATEALSTSAANLLSSSISSLSSSASRHSSSGITKAYRQASQLFLTRRLPEALSTILPLITPAPPPPPSPDADPDGLVEPAPVARASRTTRIKLWSLYLTILHAVVELEPDEGKDAFGTHEWRAICAKVRDGDVWEEVVQNGYHGVEGDVDSDVVINLATLLLAHARTQAQNQKRLESYLAASATPTLDLSGRFSSPAPRLSSSRARRRSMSKGGHGPGHGHGHGPSGADTPRDLHARVKILELYTLHVLLRNDEWDYAREFISASAVLDEERREAFLQALASLQEEQAEAGRHAREEKLRQEEQLQRDLEEARRRRAESEERERRRVEVETARREGSEVDYGIDGTPGSAAGPGHGGRARHGRSPSAAPSPSPSPSSSGARRPPAGKTPVSRAKGAGGKTVAAAAAAPGVGVGVRLAAAFASLRALVERLRASLQTNPRLLLRTLAFVVGLLLMLSRRGVRERIARVLGTSWGKIRATAGMGVKVSYI